MGYMKNLKLTINTNSKPCKICHITKPLTEFGKDAQVKSGISNRCKACDKIKNAKRKRVGFIWQDVKNLSETLEEKFDGLYGTSNVKVKGKLVMRKGKVIDEAWYQKKLNRLKKGMGK